MIWSTPFQAIFCLVATLITDSTHARFSVWQTETPLPSPRSDMSATSVNDRYIYVIGGCSGDQVVYCPEITSSCSIFDSLTETFTSCPDAPRPRYRHSAVLVDNSEIYLFGGRDITDLLIPEIDVYNINSNSWRTLNLTLWYNPKSDFASFAINPDNSDITTLIYLIGGYNQNYGTLSCMNILNITKNDDITDGYLYNWLDSSEYECMDETRGDFGVAVIGEYAYVMGGFSNDTYFCSASSTTERYNYNLNKWNYVSSFKQGRGDKAVGILNNEIFLFGGEHNANCTQTAIPLKDVQVYNVNDDEWNQDNINIPENRFRFAAATCNNSIYIFGGQKYYNDTCKCFAIADDVLRYSLSDENDGGKKKKNDNGSNPFAIIIIVVSIFVLAMVIAGVVIYKKRKETGNQVEYQ